MMGGAVWDIPEGGDAGMLKIIPDCVEAQYKKKL